MRVESIQLETCHSVYFLREKVSIWCNGESARTSCDFPYVIVTIGNTGSIAIITGPAANVICVVTAADHGIHEAVNEHVIDYSRALRVVVVPIC